jgi:hypothetical protein
MDDVEQQVESQTESDTVPTGGDFSAMSRFAEIDHGLSDGWEATPRFGRDELAFRGGIGLGERGQRAAEVQHGCVGLKARLDGCCATDCVDASPSCSRRARLRAKEEAFCFSWWWQQDCW